MVKKNEMSHEPQASKGELALKIRDDESEGEDEDEYGGELFGEDMGDSGLDEFGLGVDGDESDAPEMMDKGEAKSIFEKSYKETKSKKASKKSGGLFDGLFSQNLESVDIDKFTEKRKVDKLAEDQEKLLNKKRSVLQKRNEKIAKKDKNLKRIVFVNKTSG